MKQKKYLFLTSNRHKLLHSRESEETLAKMLPDETLAELKDFFQKSEPGDYYVDTKFVLACVK